MSLLVDAVEEDKDNTQYQCGLKNTKDGAQGFDHKSQCHSPQEGVEQLAQQIDAYYNCDKCDGKGNYSGP